MAQTEQTRFAATMALLRSLVLLVAGLFALIAPANALTFVVVLGGCLLIVDGVLSLASQDFGTQRNWPFWLSLARSVLAILAGLALLFSPWLVQSIPMSWLANFVGAQAVIIGLIEMVIIIRDRDRHASVWRPLAAAALYVALGLLLLFIPFAGALLLVQVGGALVTLFAVLNLVQTWSAIRNAPGIRPLS